MIWNNYYDTVNYKKKSGKLDKGGALIYDIDKQIQVRQVSGGEQQILNIEGREIKYTKEYQIPFMIDEGDLIDNRIVVFVEPSKDVFGNFHFCIAKVE